VSNVGIAKHQEYITGLGLWFRLTFRASIRLAQNMAWPSPEYFNAFIVNTRTDPSLS